MKAVFGPFTTATRFDIMLLWEDFGIVTALLSGSLRDNTLVITHAIMLYRTYASPSHDKSAARNTEGENLICFGIDEGGSIVENVDDHASEDEQEVEDMLFEDEGEREAQELLFRDGVEVCILL